MCFTQWAKRSWIEPGTAPKNYHIGQNTQRIEVLRFTCTVSFIFIGFYAYTTLRFAVATQNKLSSRKNCEIRIPVPASHTSICKNSFIVVPLREPLDVRFTDGLAFHGQMRSVHSV